MSKLENRGFPWGALCPSHDGLLSRESFSLEPWNHFGLTAPLRSQEPQGSLASSSQPPQEMLPMARWIRDIQHWLGGLGMLRTSLAGGCCWEELFLWLGWMFQGAASLPSQSTGIVRVSFFTKDFVL